MAHLLLNEFELHGDVVGFRCDKATALQMFANLEKFAESGNKQAFRSLKHAMQCTFFECEETGKTLKLTELTIFEEKLISKRYLYNKKKYEMKKIKLKEKQNSLNEQLKGKTPLEIGIIRGTYKMEDYHSIEKDYTEQEFKEEAKLLLSCGHKIDDPDFGKFVVHSIHLRRLRKYLAAKETAEVMKEWRSMCHCEVFKDSLIK